MTFILTCISECGTYRETINCLDIGEANRYADTLRNQGWIVSIILA